MKKIKICLITLCTAGVIATFLSGCSLFGLDMQKDYNRKTNVDTLDAHLYKNAWQYLKSRAYGSKTDTIFRRMYDAIIYSGIDTNLYIQQNQTFIFFTNNAVTTKNTGYWAAYLTSAKKAAKSWKDYNAADLKSYLLYLIIKGQYSHYNLPISDVSVNTLAPAGTFTNNLAGFILPAPFVSNPNSIMTIRVQDASASNTSDYPLAVNGNSYITTSDLLATNGVVQVVSYPMPVLSTQ